VADLSWVELPPPEHEAVDVSPYPRAISIAVAFPGAVVQELAKGPSRTYLYYYRVLNTRLDDIALGLAVLLQRKGYRAFPIPASQRQGSDRYQSIFSHRMAANLAGLGWIGRSCHLTAPHFGPRVRLVTVLTDAPLASDKPLRDGCNECIECVVNCPAGAFTGVPFHIGQPLSERFNPALCDAYKNQVRDRWGRRCCGICLAVCPVGLLRDSGDGM
jgi:epoxyqueuosine reductase QueG